MMTGELEEELRYLADNGISRDAVERVVQARAQRARELAGDMLEAITKLDLGVWRGAPVPEDQRYGKGPRLTTTDLDGMSRSLAAARAYWTAAVDHVDVEEIRDVAVRGLARRLRTGDRETVDVLLSGNVSSGG